MKPSELERWIVSLPNQWLGVPKSQAAVICPGLKMFYLEYQQLRYTANDLEVAVGTLKTSMEARGVAHGVTIWRRAPHCMKIRDANTGVVRWHCGAQLVVAPPGYMPLDARDKPKIKVTCDDADPPPLDHHPDVMTADRVDGIRAD
jgi:hypothetical protein